MKRLLAALGLLALAATAHAHYPVLEADTPEVHPGETVTIDFGNGHPFLNDRFHVSRPRRVDVLDPWGGRHSLTAAITTAGTPHVRAWRVQHTLPDAGDYVFGFDCGPFVEPPQRQINDYAKLIVHAHGAQVGWDQLLGHPLEILPLTRPYALPVGATFRGRVLLQGEPMGEAAVEAETYTDTLPDPLPELARYRRDERCDADGNFAITLDRPGWWLLSVATDGGPGRQGSSPFPVDRAVLWLFVGDHDGSRRPLAPVFPD